MIKLLCNLDFALCVAVLGAAVWRYEFTWKIIKFYIDYIKYKKYRRIWVYISFLSFLISGLIFYKVTIVLWFLTVYLAHTAYINYNDVKYKRGFAVSGFNPIPRFIAKRESKDKKSAKILFSNTQTVNYWYDKKSRLEVNWGKRITYIGIAQKGAICVQLRPYVNLKSIYMDKSKHIKIRFAAAFESINVFIKIEDVEDTYAAQIITFDSPKTTKEIEAQRGEIMKRLGVYNIESGHKNGFFSWKIINEMTNYKFWPAFKEAKKTGFMPVLIGQAEGPVVIDIVKSFHWLIVGSTGAGKSNTVNALISCMLLSRGAKESKFYFLDPKEVELIKYKDYGVYKGQKAEILAELRGLEKEMNARYVYLAKEGADCIEKLKSKRLGYKIIIVEEIADIMLDKKYKDEFAQIIQSLGQKGRAAGFRLFLITQAPYKEVIKGPIKANMANRLVGLMPDNPSSIIVLGDSRACKLSGEAGEMVLKMAGFNGVLKTPWVSDDDAREISKALKKHYNKISLVKE